MEKKQTVMAALIERVRAQYETLCGRDEWENGQQIAYEAILNDADEMLKEEREQIEEAYHTAQIELIAIIDEVTGKNFSKLPLITEDKEDAQDYYNSTYGEIIPDNI